MGSSFPGPIPPGPPGDHAPILDRGGWPLGLLLAATFALRAIHPNQPIVENYVGRQIPTAMVARNLERGSGFLHPELDTGPFPNHFRVEPPIYAQVVASVRSIFGFELEPTGRLVSAAAITLGAWGLFGLVRRREGWAVALLAVAAFGLFPVTIRFGRAFQPDALMIGFVLSGLRGWDAFDGDGNRRWAALGGLALAAGLALKITSAWILLPFVLIVRRWPVAWRLVAAVAMVAPGFAWYLYAWGEVTRPQAGSLASSDNAAIWIRSVDPSAWLRRATWSDLGWSLVARSFTPVGFALAVLGSSGKPRLDRLWIGWGVGCGLSIVVLAAKWHHAYYWMAVAPLAAVAMARGLVGLARRGRWGVIAAVVLGSSFLALSAAQSASTWRTPWEWSEVAKAAGEVRDLVPADAPLIAPEALLYLVDRRGFRLEFDPSAMARAAGELGEKLPEPAGTLDLVALYRSRGDLRVPDVGQGPTFQHGMSTCFVADAGLDPGDARRAAWREAIRASPGIKVRVDRPGLFLAEIR